MKPEWDQKSNHDEAPDLAKSSIPNTKMGNNLAGYRIHTVESN